MEENRTRIKVGDLNNLYEPEWTTIEIDSDFSEDDYDITKYHRQEEEIRTFTQVQKDEKLEEELQ